MAMLPKRCFVVSDSLSVGLGFVVTSVGAVMIEASAAIPVARLEDGWRMMLLPEIQSLPPSPLQDL